MGRGMSRGAFAALAAVWGAVGAAALTGGLQAQEEAGTLDVDGAEIFYRSLGSGPSVLVLHGGPSIGHGYLLAGLLELSADYRVIFFDQRGIGLSTGAADTTRLTVSRYLDDVEAVRAALVGEEEPVHLVGHSWGAALALSYAVDRPELVHSLTLIDPTEPGSRYRTGRDENLARATTAVDSTELAALFGSARYRSGDPSAVEDIYRVIYRPWLGDRAAASRFVFGLDVEMAARGRDVGARVSAANAGLARWADLGRLEARTLIVHGELDPIPIEMARALAEEIEDATLVELDGVGHFPMVEAPERLLEALRGFLDGGAPGSQQLAMPTTVTPEWSPAGSGAPSSRISLPTLVRAASIVVVAAGPCQGESQPQLSATDRRPAAMSSAQAWTARTCPPTSRPDREDGMNETPGNISPRDAIRSTSGARSW